MERLTYDFALGGNHCWQVKGADNLECREVCERQGDAGCKTCPIAKAFDRLAAIEDILGDEYGLDRLRELAQADREGRRVVLPCKVGDTLYDIYEAMENGTGEIRELKVNDIRIHLDKRSKEWLIAGGYYFSLSDFGKTVFLTRAEADAALRREKE